MADFGRYPSLYRDLEPAIVRQFENFNKLSLEGDFNAVDKLWKSSLQSRPRSFLREITYIDSILRQNRYGDARDYIEELLVDRHKAELLYTANQLLLLDLINGYTGIYINGALRYALKVARAWRAQIEEGGLWVANEDHVHAVEIYLRIIKYAKYHSTYVTKGDLTLPLSVTNQSEGQWAYFETWIGFLFEKQRCLEILPITNILAPVIPPENIIRVFREITERDDKLDYYTLFFSIRAHTSFSRFLSTKGEYDKAKAYIDYTLTLLDKYTQGHPSAPPYLWVQYQLAVFERDQPNLEVPAQYLRFADIAETCRHNQIWGLEDYCLDALARLAAQNGDLEQMTLRQSRLEEVQNSLERDRVAMANTQCGFWRPGNQADNGRMLQWFSIYESQFPLSLFFAAGDTFDPNPSDWDLPAVRYRIEHVKYHSYRTGRTAQAEKQALKAAQSILPFVPMEDIQQLGNDVGEKWYLEWSSSGSVEGISDFEVLARRFRMSFGDLTEEEASNNDILRRLFYPERLGDRSELWSWKPTFKIANTTADDVSKLIFPSPIEERLFMVRKQALEEWLSHDDTYDPDASQLIIAKLLHSRIWVPASTGDQFGNLKTDVDRFVEYVGQIKKPSVRKYLQRTVLRAKQTPFDFELVLNPSPDFPKLRQAFLDLLNRYEGTELAGEYSLIGNLYAQLAEVELRSAPALDGLPAFRERIAQSERYFDDLRGGLSLLPGSLGLKMKGTSPNAGLLASRKPLDRPIELLLERYFALAEGATKMKRVLARDIWNFVQRIKERSLNDMLSLSNQMPQHLMDKVKKDAEAAKGWEEWQVNLKSLDRIREAGLRGKADAPAVEAARRSLRKRELEMARNDILAMVLALHQGSVATIEEMVETLRGDSSHDEIFLVDWFTATKGNVARKLYMIVLIIGPEVNEPSIHIFDTPGAGPKSEKWVEIYLKPGTPDKPLREPNERLAAPGAYRTLQFLKALVAPLAQVLRPKQRDGRSIKQRLVFCPCTTWDVHRIPLHALELPVPQIESGLKDLNLQDNTDVAKESSSKIQIIKPEELPLFLHYEITYTHSCSLLRLSAVSRHNISLQSLYQATKAAVFNTQCASFLPPRRKGAKLREDPASIKAMETEVDSGISTLSEIAASTADLSYLLGCTPYTNKDVTRNNLVQSLRDSIFTWHMGHVDGGTKVSPLDAHLVLSPGERYGTPKVGAAAPSEAQQEGVPPTSSLTGEAIISESTLPEGAHMCLISCRGGVTEENATDEVLGLVPALFQAGARSVLTPLWEINKEDGATWTSLLCDTWRSAEWKIRGDDEDDVKPDVKMLDLAKVSQEASRRLFEIRGRDNVAAWAGFVWYGFWDFPRLPVTME